MAKRKRRNFTPEFKAEAVLEALHGESSQAEVCRCHNFSEDQVSKWKHQFLENAASVFAATDKQSSDPSQKVHLNDYGNITEARERIGHFITQVYNQKHPHAALGYLTSMEFQRQTFS